MKKINENFDNYTYEVSRYGTKITARSTFAGEVVTGVARCHPLDKFDEELGKKLAAARCNAKVAEKRIKNASVKLNRANRELNDALEKYKRDMKKGCDYMVDCRVAQEKAKAKLKAVMDLM